MNVKPEEKEKKQAGKRAASAVQLVYGNEEYFVSGRGRKIVDGLCPESERTFGLELIDGNSGNAAEACAALKKCVEALRTVGFFGASRVVWLQDANFFTGTRTAAVADVKTWVETLTSEIKTGLPDGQYLVITSPKIDKRSAFYKACKSRGEVFEYEKARSNSQAEKDAKSTTQKILARAGLKMTGDVLELFLDRVGTDTRQIVQEVEKLTAYLDGEKTVRRPDVEAVVPLSREAMAWKVADAVCRRDISGALHLMRQFFSRKGSEMQLVFALHKQFRFLHILKLCLGRGWLRLVEGGYRSNAEWSETAEAEELLGALGKNDPRKLHPYRALLMARQAQQYTRRELGWCRARILRTHELLVSSRVSGALLLEVLIGEISGRKREA